MFRSLFITLCLFPAVGALAQTPLDVKPGKIEPNQSLISFLNDIEKSQPVHFFYVDTWLEPFKMSAEFEGMTLREILATLLKDSEITYSFLYDYAVIFYKDPTLESQRKSLIRTALNQHKTVDQVLIGDRKSFVPGTTVILTGTVMDQEKNQPLSGATVYVNELDKVVTTDGAGHYSLSLPGGEYLLNYHLVNHLEKLVNLAIYKDGQVNMNLGEVTITLEEVLISDQRITSRRIGESTIKMLDIQRAPSFLGQVDVIKQVQTQSGVSTVSEATSGFSVRGGGVDQNLILYDGVPIFNTSHALGFFTAFNSDAISKVTFYKGGIPAEFGGRASSVLNMTAKEGGYKKWSAVGGLGLVTSNLTIGGPIKKDTSSLMISLRSSYSDWMLDLLKTKYQSIKNGSVFFYDGSVKYSHKISNLSKLTFSAYTSHDSFSLANDTVNQWQNIAASLRFDHTMPNNFFYNAGLYFGSYTYQVTDKDPSTAFNLKYGVTYPALKIDVNHTGQRHSQAFGFHSTYYSFNPGTLKPTSSKSDKIQTTMPVERAIESAVYVSDVFNWTEDFQVEGGLRLSFFNRFGPGMLYRYQSGAPREPENVVDSVRYNSGQIMKTYFGPEPRLSLRYALSAKSSIKLGYNRIYQYVHLISNTASITPVDIWQSSNAYFKPQRADQISVGYFRDSNDQGVEFYTEAFYKSLQNILDFKDGANLILNSQLETALLPGKGRSYGVEVSVNKLKGRLVGGFNYTYSRSLRQVNGAFKIEKINNGKFYPSNFDQPHILNANWRYKITRRIFFSGVFTYHTGRPVSLPQSGYIVGNVPITDFGLRNNYRIPDYHRLDLAFIVEGSNKRKKRVEGTWSFSIYNVYGRKNPYSVFFVDKGAGNLKPYQLSLIGSAVPSISYGFKF